MDMDFAEKQSLEYLHILPSDYENEDYYRMNEIMNAKEEKERPIDPMQFIKKAKK
ncbi:hypothetical protein FD50_GL000065 [Liquorilactobacillus satsumensis DSM 16230 = JCM 12392]|uniref:Uncharacterized protein n=2 Tax=Liquorilactobacillus satsumensis TaxID=259059 RepID=A0A0R1V9T4_9LACO|nr:hypothetical protein FD50_GL000065 [Liquorilactobacillus satsumensis DSM 16230 = JCM 12392]